MLSVLIETRNDEEALALTLASLIPAAIEGVVSEVVICDGGSNDGTIRVAEHAGCRCVTEEGLAETIRGAKSEWLLLLEPGSRPKEGWTEAVVEHMRSASFAACFRPLRRQAWLSWLFRGRIEEGLLLTKRQAIAITSAKVTGAVIAKAAKPRRIGAELYVAQAKKG